MSARPLQVAGYRGPGLTNRPLGVMWLPANPPDRFDASRECVQAVLESGEYRYDRDGVEPVETLVDVGLHLPDVLVTLYEWHGQGQRARCVAACERAGLRQVAARDGDGQGQHVWVRA